MFSISTTFTQYQFNYPLVQGLCKLGSFGGDDASIKAFADGSNLTLSKACRKFMCNPTKDVDLRKWAAEGLAYLTLDADVKEELVNDTQSLKSLIDLAKVMTIMMLRDLVLLTLF